MWPMNPSSSTSGQMLETRCGSTRHLLLQSALHRKLWRRQVIGPSQAGSEKQPLTISPRFFHGPSGSISEIRAGMRPTPSYPPSSKNLPQLCSSTNAQGVSNNSVAATSLFKHWNINSRCGHYSRTACGCQ